MKSEMTVDQLRQEGLRLYYANSLEEALPWFDRALEIAEDEETRDLLTIHKASIHVALRQNTSEVQSLAAIVMRRPSLRSLAAYHLATKFENEGAYSRARFYLEIAREAAEQTGNARLLTSTLIDLGNVCVYDSKPEDAVPYYDEALDQLSADAADGIFNETPTERQLWIAFATQNLGYCRLQTGEPAEGVRLIARAIEMFEICEGQAYAAESHIDLCLGYLDLGELERARMHGEIGLRDASEDRQIRNAHYLLGEVAYKAGDIDGATAHFEHLARFYPDFPQLRNLLFAIDLRNVVNFKL